MLNCGCLVDPSELGKSLVKTNPNVFETGGQEVVLPKCEKCYAPITDNDLLLIYGGVDLLDYREKAKSELLMKKQGSSGDNFSGHGQTALPGPEPFSNKQEMGGASSQKFNFCTYCETGFQGNGIMQKCGHSICYSCHTQSTAQIMTCCACSEEGKQSVLEEESKHQNPLQPKIEQSQFPHPSGSDSPIG